MALAPKQIKRIRKRLGLTRAELAAAIHVSIETVKSWELGRRNCGGTAEVLLRLYEKGQLP